MTPAPRRVRLDLAYDGTDFAGWQLQPGRRTIQAAVEEALCRIQGGVPARLRAAGRTDAGVHARRQVADGEVTTRLDDAGLLRALAALLPADVRPLAVRTVPGGFHSRRDAQSKTYAYVLDRAAQGDPFVSRFALHHPHFVDRAAIEEALRRLPGRRDFAGFAGADRATGSTVRDLLAARYQELEGELAVLSFTAGGFLNHMVRNLVGTLLEVARGRFAPGRIDEILASRDRRLAGPTAPARGLHLDRVTYAGEPEGDGGIGRRLRVLPLI
jgi:tRNA pseudouridine38-40 synthase